MRGLVPVVAALPCAGRLPPRWTTFSPSASLPGAVDFQVPLQTAAADPAHPPDPVPRGALRAVSRDGRQDCCDLAPAPTS